MRIPPCKKLGAESKRRRQTEDHSSVETCDFQFTVLEVPVPIFWIPSENMDTQKLIVLLRATMDPNDRKSAEDQLAQVRIR